MKDYNEWFNTNWTYCDQFDIDCDDDPMIEYNNYINRINQINEKRNKSFNNEFKNWIFFTISPDKIKHGSLTMDNYNDLKQWCDNWFQDYNYNQYFYAIESGKDINNPHLHIHALVKGLNNKLKKNGHYKVLINQWNMKIPLITVGSFQEKIATNKSYDILYQMINDKDLWVKKYNYLNNDLKGTHRNFINLAGTQG